MLILDPTTSYDGLYLVSAYLTISLIFHELTTCNQEGDFDGRLMSSFFLIHSRPRRKSITMADTILITRLNPRCPFTGIIRPMPDKVNNALLADPRP